MKMLRYFNLNRIIFVQRSRERKRSDDVKSEVQVKSEKHVKSENEEESPDMSLSNAQAVRPRSILDDKPRGGVGGKSGQFTPPAIYSIHKGVVAKVLDFGAFVEIKFSESDKKQGLVHWTQLVNQVFFHACVIVLCFN